MSGHLNYIKGDLFGSFRRILAHGVNCRGGFGSGVAGRMAAEFPRVRQAYLAKHADPGWKLGEIQVVVARDSPERIVVNLATQQDFGSDGRVYVNYEAVGLCVARLLRFAAEVGGGVAIPKIGCGLAGGDWAKVEAILRKHLLHADVEVDVHTL